MAYVKPGVEIKQEQTSVSPNLISPDLKAVIIGQPYFVADVDDYSYNDEYDNSSSLEVTLAGLPTSAVLDSEDIWVDLIINSGVNAGSVVHVDNAKLSYTGGVVTVAANAYSGTSYSSETANANVKVGYRAKRADLPSFMDFESFTDIETEVGKAYSFNDLAFGLSKALTSAGRTVSAVPVNGSLTSNISTAVDAITTKEVYAICPLSNDNSTVISTLAAHATTYSGPTYKKERMVVASPAIAWDDNTSETTKAANKSTTAANVKSLAFAYQNRRLVLVFPDTFYVTEERHVSTLVQATLDRFQGTDSLPAFLASDYTVTVSGTATKYKKGTQLTSTILTNLAAENTNLLVDVPVLGFHAAATVAGQISGFLPETPLTNQVLTGFSKVKYSSDWFNDAHLNTIAEGGNMIFYQTTDAAPVTCRHQLTTDMTSVERREINILKTLDYVAKFVRNGLVGYIGRYNITPQFLKLLKMTVQAQALFLVREGRLNDMKISQLIQDEIQKDTILLTFEVEVKYPVNYIKITLQF